MTDGYIKIDGAKSNYLQPFFNIKKDESIESLRARFKKHRDMGIYSLVLCLASEGGMMKLTKFDGEWWDTLKRVTVLCREMGMTYWIQDAAPFPTGAAEGWFAEKEEYKEKRKVYLTERHINVVGPKKNAVILAERQRNSIRGDIFMVLEKPNERDKLLYAVALKRAEVKSGGANRLVIYDYNSAVDVTDKINDGILTMDVPEGIWRIFFIYESRNGGRANYMNLLDEESVAVLTEALHKPHYERLRDEIGKTWNGFFYDEPEIGNVPGYDFYCLPGSVYQGTPAPIPWSRQTAERMIARYGDEYIKALPCLWYNCGEMTGVFRYNYMNIITKLVSESYNGQVHRWCRERGIGYIGHVLEDESSHARLGCGPGHFFRMEKHQDMAGVDLVSSQILPGLDFQGVSWYGSSDGDGEFYHYGLAKLASSEAHINPDKNGKSICELLALYGNIISPKQYKFYIDHLLVNGINNFIPTGVETLDTEQARMLFDYANRMCILVRDGIHIAPAAILYHAEAEWAGQAQYFHRPAKELAVNQIDYDVIPCDALLESEFYRSKVENGVLKINTAEYKTLIIPYSERIPKDVLAFLINAKQNGLRVFFVDGLPSGYCDELDEIDSAVALFNTAPLECLAAKLTEKNIYNIRLSRNNNFIRYNHIKKDGKDIYLIHNEHPYDSVSVSVSFADTRSVCHYNVMDNRLTPVKSRIEGDRTWIDINLGQFEMSIVIFGDFAGEPTECKRKIIIEKWDVSVDIDDKIETITQTALSDTLISDINPRQVGKIMYKSCFSLERVGCRCMLKLGCVYDGARVFIGGAEVGLRIAEPYEFDISSVVTEGENEITVEVYPNKARAKPAGLFAMMTSSIDAAAYSVLDPIGMTGSVEISIY